MTSTRRALTLVELIIVMIIIGLLASMSVSMMQSMKARAICSEAVMAMSALRTGAEEWFIEHKNQAGDFPGDFRQDYLTGLGFTDLNSLTGTYFSYKAYYVYILSGGVIYVWCQVDNSNNSAAARAIVDSSGFGPYPYLVIHYHKPGITDGIYQCLVSKSGYPQDTDSCYPVP